MAITEQGNDNDTRAATGTAAGAAAGAEEVALPPEAGTVRMSFRDLLVDPRFRRWSQRAGFALLGGLFVALMTNVRIGLTLAIVVIVADAVHRARMQSSVDAWQKRASSAERRTERQLHTLEKKHGYRILHARAVPRDSDGVSDGKIDHLVIGPSGVYAIDSEKWDKRLPVRTLSHRKLFHGPFNKKDRLDEARWEADQAGKKLSAAVGFDIPVQPSVAIYGPAIPWKVLTVRDVDVYSGSRAKSYLRRRPRILTEDDVQRIYKIAQMTLPPVYGPGEQGLEQAAPQADDHSHHPA